MESAPVVGSEPQKQALRVLVVDDDVDTCQSMALVLQKDGHEAHLSFDGRDAIRQVTELAPDVLLLDIGMPAVDGLHVARLVRQLELPAQPVLAALSGYATRYHKRLCAQAEFDHYLVKPVEPLALYHLLRMVRVGRALHDTARELRREQQASVYALALSQIEFEGVMLDLAQNLTEEARQRCLVKARQLHARIARWLDQQAVCSPEQKAKLQALLDALRDRIM